MELRHIRYFLAVAEERNFTRAARRLGIGQPPLSQQIRDLETELQVTLFHRLPHGAELTAAGEAFRDSVIAIPAQTVAAVAAARRAARGETGSVRVGFTGSAAFNPRVPAVIRAFRRLHPDVDLSLREDNSNGLVGALTEGRIDVAFLRPDAIDGEGLQLHQMECEALLAALSSSRMAHDDPIALNELRHDPFLLIPRHLGPSMYDTTMQACKNVGFEPVLGQSAPQIASILALVSAEMGVALVPASMRDVAMRGVTYHDLIGSAPSTILAIAHRKGDRSPTVAAFVAQARFETL